MKREICVLLNIALLAGMMSGCQAPRYGNFNPAEMNLPPPSFAVLYHPYGPALDRAHAEPIPDYSGWPRERMIRDMQRLQHAGIDIVFTSIDFSRLHGTRRLQQYEVFASLVAENPDWPRLAYWVTQENTDSDGAKRSQLTEWLVMQTTRYPAAHYRYKSRPLIILAPSFRHWAFPHPALSFRLTNSFHKQWTWTPPATGSVKLAPNREHSIVFAGWHPAPGQFFDTEWVIPREEGETLRTGLREAIPLWTDIICIDSWNNYRNGSFIEPNTAEGKKLYQVLKDEIKYFRRKAKSSD